jgi:hypothetical protein
MGKVFLRKTRKPSLKGIRMSKSKQAKVFTSIDAWSEHYLPGYTAAEREAREPFKEVVSRRVAEILVERSDEAPLDLEAIEREAREPFEPAIQGIIAEKLYERVVVTL